MSWASNRHTTRVEDQAYCLLGIFGVNMPMLCGEDEEGEGTVKVLAVLMRTDAISVTVRKEVL